MSSQNGNGGDGGGGGRRDAVRGGRRKNSRSTPRRASEPGGRMEKTRVRTAKGRRLSSTLWLRRQLNDPYVQAARREGYRSRAAYKLLELDERFGLLKSGQKVVDLGAAPGGWTQVAVLLTKSLSNSGAVILAVDINEMEELPGAEVLLGDINDLATSEAIRARLNGPADLVLSDVAPPASGHRGSDHLRIIGLAEAAFALARDVLAPGGAFIAKVWQGGADSELLSQLKRDFTKVRHAKPKASRSSSAEMYLVATGFRGQVSGDNRDS